jgi:hypothetical protein
MPSAVGECQPINYAVTLISPENGTMMRSRCGVKRLIFPLGTPILPFISAIPDSLFRRFHSVEFVV